MKYSFRNDYSEMAHPKVLEALSAIGSNQFGGYGLDEFSNKAADIIKATISANDADVHFISGGTQANLVVIASSLRPHEAVISIESGHVFEHETGAIEATGHKICTVKGLGGKVTVSEIEELVASHNSEHTVYPRMVYISHTTECGTIHSKAELSGISKCCRDNNLYLFLDGARLGAAINSPYSDMSYTDIAALTDVFTIGGTKNGALFGEAIVICADELKRDFRFALKQRGAMLAKGAALGLQFDALLKDGLYDELAQHSNAMALQIAEGIKKEGYDFLYPPQTNLIIPIFPTAVADKLHQLYGFNNWETRGNSTAVRIVTSWATPQSIAKEFIADLAAT